MGMSWVFTLAAISGAYPCRPDIRSSAPPWRLASDAKAGNAVAELDCGQIAVRGGDSSAVAMILKVLAFHQTEWRALF